LSKTLTKRQQVESQVEFMRTEREPFIQQWREIAENLFPTRPRFLLERNTDRGKKKYNKILDLAGALAARVLPAGMMAGLTSPARPWKRLTVHDPGLAEFGPVKDWLHMADTRMSSIFSRSNLYSAFPNLYKDSGGMGTGVMEIEEDFDKVIRAYVYPVGSYMLACDYKLRVNVFARELTLTVRQVVERFGRITESGAPDWSRFSRQVKDLYDRCSYEAPVSVTHLIQPNKDYSPNNLMSQKFESLYWETGFPDATGDEGRYLREAGYGYFPILAARWDVSGEDVYGTSCPGMIALGSVNQLQYGEKKILQAHEKMIDPPMMYPLALQHKNITGLPGEKIFIDERDGTKGARSLYESRFSSEHIEAKQQQLRAMVNETFYKNLFLMFTGLDRREITAAEIYARQEEKLLLGEVLEHLNEDVYDPLIDITFDIMMRQGLLPPPPPELEGEDLKVEYVSIMHQAMKVSGLSSVDRLTGYIGQLAQFNPEVLDKFDMDQAVDEYAEILGTPPRVVRPDDEVEGIREGRRQAQQAQQQALALSEGAKTAKDLASADMGGNNALTQLIKASQTGAIV